MGNMVTHKASKMVIFHSNQFSLPQIGGIYKGKIEIKPEAQRNYTNFNA